MRTVKVLAAGALVALALAACSSGKGSGGSASGGGSGAAKGADLRIQFDKQLGEHAILSVAMLQDMINRQPAAAPEAALLVGRNTDDLGASFGSACGTSAGNQFKEQLKNQVGILVRYTVAKGGGDQPGAAKALKDLGAYQAQFVTFMAATAPKLPKQAVASDLKQQFAGMVAAVDASVRHDQAQAASQFAAVYEHAFTTGSALAAVGGDAAPRTGALSAKPDDLRTTLDMQRGEQAALTSLVLGKAISGAPDGKAFGAELGKNTQALTQSVASVYGRAAGTKFKTLWNDHLSALLNYTAAKATGDQGKVKKSQAALASFSDSLAGFLAGANPSLSKSELAGLLTKQVSQAAGAVDATYAKSTIVATSAMAGAYEQSFTIGDTLAAAIAKQFPDKFAPAN